MKIMTTEEQAKEAAHNHITERCKSTKCEEINCHPNDRQVSSYHTRCRVRYQEYRDGYIQALSDHEKEIEQLKDKAVEVLKSFCTIKYSPLCDEICGENGCNDCIKVKRFIEALNKK